MKSKSFTLIELLVVIVIIGILAGVIMTSTSSSIDKANIAKLKVFSESIKNNLMLNLISEFKLDEGSGAESKDSWGGNNLVFGLSPNNPTWIDTDCVSEKCLDFDGVGDFAKAAGFSDLGTKEKPYTIEGWVLAENGEDNGNIIFMSALSSGSGWCLPPVSITNKRIKAISYNDVGMVSATDVKDIEYNKWYHFVHVWDNVNGLILYVNGEKVATTPMTNYSASSYSNFIWIGFSPSACAGDTGFFKGKIDDIRIYNTSLSLSEIQQNYIAGLKSLLSKASISKEDYTQRINQLSLND